MKAIARKLRGMIGLGITWGLLWALIFLALGVVIGIVDPDSIDPGEEPIRIARIGLAVGFVSGFFFGGVLALAEQHRTIGDLSLVRVAVWGAIGAAILPLLTQMNNSVLATTIPLGVVSSLVTVGIGRRALPPSSTGLIEPSTEKT